MKRIHGHTFSICPECGAEIPAKIIEDDDRIFLSKECIRHGKFKSLISSDARWFADSKYFIKPRQEPLNLYRNTFKGCSSDSCGLCPAHQQHTCLPVIEITSLCDMNCPVCLKNLRQKFEMTPADFSNVIDALFNYEGDVPVINLSGGEPLLHSKIEHIFRICSEKKIMQTTVSTNGKQLFQNKKLREIIKQNDILIALQFDGFDETASLMLRGENVTPWKLKLIDIFEKEQIKYSLVSTIAAGINDLEINKITDLLFNSSAKSLMFQPVAFTGNCAKFLNESNRITIPDIIRKCAECEKVDSNDFNPLPCSHYSCFALSYYFTINSTDFLSMKKFLGFEDYLNVISNKTLPGIDLNSFELIKNKIYEFWAASDSVTEDSKVLDRIKSILKKLNETEFSSKRAFSIGADSMKAIFIHQLMDRYTADFGRLMKCCNHYSQIDGRLIPMCTANIFPGKYNG